MPIFGHTVDGNRNGHTAAAEQLALLKKHSKPAELTFISDRGTFSAGHLLRLSQSGFAAIAAAPWLGREVQPTRLTAELLALLNQLGFDAPAQILSRRLPRGP